jgi:hypothetical protein
LDVASERFSAFASCKLLENSSVQALEMSIIVLEFAEFDCRISYGKASCKTMLETGTCKLDGVALNVLEGSPIFVQELMGGRQTFTIDDTDTELNCERCFLLYFRRVFECSTS